MAGYPTDMTPFDQGKLDSLMAAEDVDVLIVSSKHNIRYLLGGYSCSFFEFSDAIGTGRYLPLLLYFRERPELATYIGSPIERDEEKQSKFWMSRVANDFWSSLDAIRMAVHIIDTAGVPIRKIGIESAFLPADAFQQLTLHFRAPAVVDALVLLERLRAVKNAIELSFIRQASEKVVQSMLAVFANHGPGTTESQLVQALKLEQIKRGLNFEYCLVTTGNELARTPSERRWKAGEIASLDSGANLNGYIGDLCRMAILGEPDAEQNDLLAEVEEIQSAARDRVRAGAIGREIFDEAAKARGRSPNRQCIAFVAHGVGLVSHEAPRLTDCGPIPYSAEDAETPLEAGMVISVETTMSHPKHGFIKLEDTVAVTQDGHEGFGDDGRGWNNASVAAETR